MNLRWLIPSLLFCVGCTLPKVDPASLQARREAERLATPAPAATPDDSLSLAASCIERGDTEGAVLHMSKHLKQHPEQIMIRAYLAELLLKLGKLSDSQDQFERFISGAQEGEGPARQHLVHSHTRLKEIAQARDDLYGEHLHRGIGMVLLARKLEMIREEPEPGFRERILCKAAQELTQAAKRRPDEPRPHWYLVEVWNKLDQSRSAEKSLKTAKAKSALLPLPPAEQRALSRAR